MLRIVKEFIRDKKITMKKFKKVFTFVYVGALVALIAINGCAGFFYGQQTSRSDLAISYIVCLVWFLLYTLYENSLDKLRKDI